MAIVVHYASQSRASMVFWALEELGLPYEKVSYDLSKGEHKTDAFKKMNPNCKVPTVVFDGTPMFESLAIVLYLGERYGADKKLFPGPTEPARIEALAWATWAIVTLGGDIGRFIEASHERVPRERHNAAQAAVALADIERDLAMLDARLEGKSFILGDAFTLADTVFGGALAYVSRIGVVPLARYPRVEGYFGRLTARPAFARAMDGTR
jgi:glutathione S-transferase